MHVNLRTHGVIILILLILQYGLGMFTNLFVEFPEGQSETQTWEFAWKQWPLAAHIILGLGLFTLAVLLCIRSARVRNKRWILASGVGLLSIFVAGASGAAFIPTQMEAYSFSMALSFVVAVVAYRWGLVS